MDSQYDSRPAFRSLSYILLSSGVFFVMPNLILGVLKIISASPSDRIYVPGSILASLLVIGHLILLVPLISIPLSALWISHRTGDLNHRSQLFLQGLQRYAPVFALEIVHVWYVLTHDNIFIPGIVGALVMIYAAFFLIFDRSYPQG